METITDFIVTSKASGLFVMPIIVSLVYALLFKSKIVLRLKFLVNSLSKNVFESKASDILRKWQ